MTNSPHNKNEEPEESRLSIGEVIAIAKAYGFEILKFSWLMILAGVALGWYMRERKLSSPTTYTAHAYFRMDESTGETQQNIASLFGTGGLSQSGSELTLKSLNEIIKTRLIVNKALFDKKKLRHEEQPKEDFLINHFLRKFSYKGGVKDPFYFQSDSISPYNQQSNRLLKRIHAVVSNSYLSIDISPARIVHIKCTTVDEDFSYELLHSLYNHLDTFYSETKIMRKEAFYEMTQERTSDLYAQLKRAEAAYIKHLNSSAAEAQGRYNTSIRTQYLSTELRTATEAYFNALRSQEGAWVSLEKQRQSPTLQMIDPPLYPLSKNVPNPFLHMVLGFVVGSGLVFMLVVGRKYLRDFLQAEQLNKEQVAKEETVPSEKSTGEV